MDEINRSSVVSIRKRNINRSPKNGGNSDEDSLPYLSELGVTIQENIQPIKFFDNRNELIHRWAPYVQGFSASFVQGQINKFIYEYKNPLILDPFSGCGTVLVQSKLNGVESIGTELNPLLKFVSEVKLNSWDVDPDILINTYDFLQPSRPANPPNFLKNEDHFDSKVLRNLQIIKGHLDALPENSEMEIKIKNLLLVAFSSIIIESSRLKRSPCLGYNSNKQVTSDAPFILMKKKVEDISEDLYIIQNKYSFYTDTRSIVHLANAKFYEHEDRYDLVITSPPYMNGLDYVMNYKIEMGWLGFADNHKQLKSIKDDMVVCDNVSKGLITNFSKNEKYSNDWIEEIKENIAENISNRGSYRRPDMPNIVHKYFDDMYLIMKQIVPAMKEGARFILVIGDSLIADVYVPTDLLIARIGLDLGLNIESIEKARTRRSGQIRSYKLRESIITLRK